MGEADSRRLLHELHVHQIEPEMQNEALRESQNQTDGLIVFWFDKVHLDFILKSDWLVCGCWSPSQLYCNGLCWLVRRLSTAGDYSPFAAISKRWV
ncbi:MAG: hypothetical protein Q8R95_04970 [Azonexus sp.]|nr:hypothetical protein [Azonexus sp.]